MRRVVAVLILASATVFPARSVANAALNCRLRFAPPVATGRVQNPRLTEASGLAASRTRPGMFWAHNDSGGEAEVFALGADGADLGSYRLIGAQNRDWEDMAVGPKSGAAGSFLYLGDIGDNASKRSQVVIYRVPEPSQPPPMRGGSLRNVERFALLYPDGAEDAESLLVDPKTGDLVVVTKSLSGRSRILSVPAAKLRDRAVVTMVDHGTIRVTGPPDARGFGARIVTGASVSADGALVLVRTYGSVLAFTRDEGASLPEALRGKPCPAPHPPETQGEAIAITIDGSRFVTLGEGTRQPVHAVSISATPKESAAATTTRASATTTAAADDSGDRNNALVTAAVTGGVVVAAVFAFLAAQTRSRRDRM